RHHVLYAGVLLHTGKNTPRSAACGLAFLDAVKNAKPQAAVVGNQEKIRCPTKPTGATRPAPARPLSPGPANPPWNTTRSSRRAPSGTARARGNGFSWERSSC